MVHTGDPHKQTYGLWDTIRLRPGLSVTRRKRRARIGLIEIGAGGVS